MTESMINGSTEQPEKLCPDTIDSLYDAAREMHMACKVRSISIRAQCTSDSKAVARRAIR